MPWCWCPSNDQKSCRTLVFTACIHSIITFCNVRSLKPGLNLDWYIKHIGWICPDSKHQWCSRLWQSAAQCVLFAFDLFSHRDAVPGKCLMASIYKRPRHHTYKESKLLEKLSHLLQDSCGQPPFWWSTAKHETRLAIVEAYTIMFKCAWWQMPGSEHYNNIILLLMRLLVRHHEYCHIAQYRMIFCESEATGLLIPDTINIPNNHLLMSSLSLCREFLTALFQIRWGWKSQKRSLPWIEVGLGVARLQRRPASNWVGLLLRCFQRMWRTRQKIW